MRQRPLRPKTRQKFFFVSFYMKGRLKRRVGGWRMRPSRFGLTLAGQALPTVKTRDAAPI